MRPYQLWLLAIVFFVVPMVIAFFLGGLARKSHSKHPQLDPDLAVAIETAKRSLPLFIQKMQKPPENAVAFIVKASFVEDGHAEMMWVDHLSYASGVFDGALADTPIVLKKLHKGEHVRVAQADVVDWEVFYHSPDGELHEGAATDRVLRARQAGHTLRYPPRMQSSRARLA